jgi:cytochrome P450
MRPSLQQYLDTLFDNMLAGPQPCDLAAEVAFPFTSKVICNLLGVPYQDYDEFMVNVGGMMNTTSPAESIAAYEAMSHYVGGLVDRSAREPVGGVVGRLVSNELASGVITRRKAIDIVIALLLGGYETSATSMALGTLVLLTYPVQFADLCANFEDTGLVSSTVEELLRFVSITHKGRRRVATQDIEIDGVTIHAGEGLVFLDDASNRDPGAFAGDVDALDIRRDTTYHVAFSAGAHHCAGSRLARLELQLFFQTLARRAPSLALASDVGDLGFRVDAQIYGVDRVPVTWTAGGQL